MIVYFLGRVNYNKIEYVKLNIIEDLTSRDRQIVKTRVESYETTKRWRLSLASRTGDSTIEMQKLFQMQNSI
jgi:hypothetical protein